MAFWIQSNSYQGTATPSNSDTNGRILKGYQGNSIFGHWRNRAGISHQGGWVNHYDHGRIKEQKSWIFAIEQPRVLIRRTAKHDWVRFSGGGRIGRDRLTINHGRNGENADFNIAELTICFFLSESSIIGYLS